MGIRPADQQYVVAPGTVGLAYEALVLSDRIAVFNGGKIEQVGTGRELYDKPATLFVGRFIGNFTVLRGSVETMGRALQCGSATNGRSVAQDGGDGIARDPASAGEPCDQQTWRNIARRALLFVRHFVGSCLSRIGRKVRGAARRRFGSDRQITLTSETLSIGDLITLSFKQADAKLLPDDKSADTTLT